MLYCPCCDYDRDVVNFPKYMSGLRGLVCKRCLAELSHYPDNHWKVRKWENAGFQKETPGATRARMLLMERDILVEEKRKKGITI